MVTPFTESQEIDYDSLARAIEWYIGHGVEGLFAVCQSSEMFHLRLEERVRLAAFVKKKADGRVAVVASGHISERFEDQVEELNAMAATGIDALILLTNRLTKEEESDEVWKMRLDDLLKRLPEHMPLGFYECPYPYKRLMSPELLKWCAETGRFRFLKDTSCDIPSMKAKLAAVQGTGLRVYNANSATLLETLKLGIAGYSGIMANFHPELYVWLVKNGLTRSAEADYVADFLSVASLIEKQMYPVNAKYHLMRQGVYSTNVTRSINHEGFSGTNRLEVDQLSRLAQSVARFIGLSS